MWGNTHCARSRATLVGVISERPLYRRPDSPVVGNPVVGLAVERPDRPGERQSCGDWSSFLRTSAGEHEKKISANQEFSGGFHRSLSRFIVRR